MKSQNPNPKPYDLRERTFDFAARLLDVTAALPNTAEAQVVRGQLARAGTSVGANVEEADGAGTRADRRKSFVVARKECREARYWLRLIERKWNGAIDVRADVSEATELLRILSAIIDKLGNPKPQ